jgi:hypothetical protein
MFTVIRSKLRTVNYITNHNLFIKHLYVNCESIIYVNVKCNNIPAKDGQKQ